MSGQQEGRTVPFYNELTMAAVNAQVRSNHQTVYIQVLRMIYDKYLTEM